MKNNKGITLISLLSSVVLILILASITVVTSTNAYKQMKFEGAKAEIEEMQKLVDEIATDYQTYLSEQNSTTKDYKDYFKDRYGSGSTDFSGKLLSDSTNKNKASTLISKVNDSALTTPGTTVFYFSKDDINKYFDLKGINDVVVDFSTRTVYSVNGIQDPDDKTKVYYQASEWNDDKKVNSTSNSNTITVTASKAGNNGTNFDVQITLNGKINKVSEVYGGIGKYSKIDNFRVISSTATQTVIKVSVSGAGSYQFKVVDELNNSYTTSLALN